MHPAGNVQGYRAASLQRNLYAMQGPAHAQCQEPVVTLLASCNCMQLHAMRTNLRAQPSTYCYSPYN